METVSKFPRCKQLPSSALDQQFFMTVHAIVAQYGPLTAISMLRGASRGLEARLWPFYSVSVKEE